MNIHSTRHNGRMSFSDNRLHHKTKAIQETIFVKNHKECEELIMLTGIEQLDCAREFVRIAPEEGLIYTRQSDIRVLHLR